MNTYKSTGVLDKIPNMDVRGGREKDRQFLQLVYSTVVKWLCYIPIEDLLILVGHVEIDCLKKAIGNVAEVGFCYEDSTVKFNGIPVLEIYKDTYFNVVSTRHGVSTQYIPLPPDTLTRKIRF